MHLTAARNGLKFLSLTTPPPHYPAPTFIRSTTYTTNAIFCVSLLRSFHFIACTQHSTYSSLLSLLHHHCVSLLCHQIHLPRGLATGSTGLLLHAGPVHAAVHRAAAGADIHLHPHCHCRVGQASTWRGRELARPTHGALQAQGKFESLAPPLSRQPKNEHNINPFIPRTTTKTNFRQNGFGH